MTNALQKAQENILSKPLGSVFPDDDAPTPKGNSKPFPHTSSRTADKFVVRLPDGMRERIAQVARTRHRSMNSEVINTLSVHLQLIDLGHAQLIESLLKGDADAEQVGQVLNSQPERIRGGDPVMFHGALWIVDNLEAKGNVLYANISRENPANSMHEKTTVRYSALAAYVG